MSIFSAIQNAVQNAGNAAQNTVNQATSYRERTLSQSEYNLVRDRVFRNTLPSRDRINLSNGLGAQKRPYTIPHPAKPSQYLIHIGADAYNDASVPNYDIVLVHEMTHVWQGFNGFTPWNYVCNSMIDQFLHGGSAYNYTLGNSWSSFSAEAQAQIVEDWYRLGRVENDTQPRWHYIRDNIRNRMR